MKKRIYIVIYLFLFFSILGGFFYQNQKNYIKGKELHYNFIQHPELLPNKDIAQYTSFGFSNLTADMYWLKTIQYIGGNAIGSEYKKYLYSMLDLITELNPYFEKPYLIGQLLLPSYNQRYENLSDESQNQHTKQGELLGLKGIHNFCDKKKIQLIRNEENLGNLWDNPIYKNPCKTSNIPFSQGFLYYFYLKNPSESAQYYKIASVNDDSLEGAKSMAAIMSGKSGNREKSIMMFVTLAKAQNKKNEKCQIFSDEIEKLSFQIFRNNFVLNSKILKNIEALRKEHYAFNKEMEQELVIGETCSNYINKAIRELNLAYIENANAKYFQDYKGNAENPKILFEKGYIDYIPVDFQQYEDYGIIYYFNHETGNFDYKMGYENE